MIDSSSLASLRSGSTSRSTGSRLPVRELLFGEIDTSTTQSLRSNTSICNLTLSSSSTSLKFWLNDSIRANLLSFLDTAELSKLRFVCHDFSGKVAAALFDELHVNFRATTFSKPSRVAALERIGRHVRTLTLSLPHSPESSLPPLIDPATGEERQFVYMPHLKPPSRSAPCDYENHPTFGSLENAELLVKQYPPIFHAATNISAFVRAFCALRNLTHLKISCPGTRMEQHGRRSVVDYALISLRMAVERAPLNHLEALSFLPIHPSGLLYMQPLMGYGAGPNSMRRWAQIRRMEVHMESFDVEPDARLDQLKTLHTYLRNFANSLTSFFFRWNGVKGPCPISLATEPCMCAGADTSRLRAIHFAALSHMELENAEMDAAQVSAFIDEHRRTLAEFKFEQVKLRTGDWDEALSPLSKMMRNDKWKRRRQTEDCMDVPIMLGPMNVKPLPKQKVEEASLHEGVSSPFNLYKMLSRATQSRAARATQRAREHINESSEQMKRLLRSSLLGHR